MKTPIEILNEYLPADSGNNLINEAVCISAMREYATLSVEAAFKNEWVPISEGAPDKSYFDGEVAVFVDGKILYGCWFTEYGEGLYDFYKRDTCIVGVTHYCILDLTPPNI